MKHCGASAVKTLTGPLTREDINDKQPAAASALLIEACSRANWCYLRLCRDWYSDQRLDLLDSTIIFSHYYHSQVVKQRTQDSLLLGPTLVILQ